MGTGSNTIGTADGRSITPPKAMIPRRPTPPASAFPFSEDVALVIADHWSHGADYLVIADAVVDLVCKHLRSPLARLDRRLVDAIEDHMSHDPLEGDLDQATECSVDDLERQRASAHAMATMKTSGDLHVRTNAAAALATMLKRPEESDRYNALRLQGHTPASALSMILAERRVASMITEPRKGSCCQCGADLSGNGQCYISPMPDGCRCYCHGCYHLNEKNWAGGAL